MLTRRQSHITKVLHSGYTFTSREKFSDGILPTKKEVLERVLHEEKFLQQSAADLVATELVTHWIWCNVYPLSKITAANKISDMIKTFSSLDRYDKKKRGPTFFNKESEFLEDIDKLFDIYCDDSKQLKALEQKYNLKMVDKDYRFYEDQKNLRIGRCLPIIEPLSPSDHKFLRRSRNMTYTEPCTSVNSSMQFSDTDSNNSADSNTIIASSFFNAPHSPTSQNRKSWPNVSLMCERYQLSDRAGAAVANGVLKDLGILTDVDNSCAIDRSKLRREREKYRAELRTEEDKYFQLVNALYVDGKKDATLAMLQGENGKLYRQTMLEEHYVVVGEPGEFYLTHVTPENGRGRIIAQALFEAIKTTELEGKLSLIGSDGTAAMTGPYNGFIRALEETLEKPLQWVICLLHCNELPLRHVFVEIDGTTKSPDAFSGKIGKELSGSASDWSVEKFKPIANQTFPLLSNDVVDDLSTDQHYAYKICWAVILGHVDIDLELLEIGPMFHSRWLTLACRILRYYTSTSKPSPNLCILAEFCIKVYFPTWFQIKSKHKVTDGAKNLFCLIQRITKFSNKKVREIALKVVQRNAFFAHPENILLGMLADENEEVRRIAVNKILVIRGAINCEIEQLEIGNYEEGHVEISDEEENTERTGNSVRRFLVPKLNFKAKEYFKLVNMNGSDILEPPAIKNLDNSEIEDIQTHPLCLKHPCHNQAVERHIKLVTQASSSVAGYERRDGLIRQKIKSRRLMKVFNTKKQFAA